MSTVPTDSCHRLRSQVLITQNQRSQAIVPHPPNCYSHTMLSTYWWRLRLTSSNAHPQNLDCRIILPEHMSYKCHPIPAKFSNTSPKPLGLPIGALYRDATRRKESPGAVHTHTHSQTVQARHMLCIQVPQ